MKCKHCGKEIANDSNFCEYCGAKVKKRMPWWAILLIVLGGLSFIGWGTLFAFFISQELHDNGHIEDTPKEPVVDEVTIEEAAVEVVPVAEQPVVKEEAIDASAASANVQSRANNYVATSTQQKPVKLVPAGYVDLGLSVYWKETNEMNGFGFYTYDDAKSRFGGKLPTKEQLEELKSRCTWTWDSSKKGYYVKGTNGNSIFLPAAGIRDCSGDVYYVGTYGYYWSFTPDGSEDAWVLYFGSSGVYMDYGSRCYGRSVRLVQGK